MLGSLVIMKTKAKSIKSRRRGNRQRANSPVRSTAARGSRLPTDSTRQVRGLQKRLTKLEQQHEELQQAHAETNAQLTRYLHLFDLAPVGCFMFNEHGKICDVNPTAVELLGRERARILGRRFQSFLTPQTRPEFNEFLRCIFTERTKQVCEARLKTKPPHAVHLHLEGTVIARKGPKHASFCHAVAVDVSHYKQAEQALLQSEQRFREMLETLELVAVILDRQGRVVFANAHLLAQTGRRKEEVIGGNWFEQFVPAEPAVRRMFERAVRTGRFPRRYENDIRLHNGERRLISWSNTVLRDARGQITGSASIGEDITERRRAAQALQESEARYRRLFENSPVSLWEEDLSAVKARLSALQATVGDDLASLPRGAPGSRRGLRRPSARHRGESQDPGNV